MDDAVWKQTWGEALNQQQAAAVQAADGPVLLLAVPGSGKTTVLIHRLGYLMDCRGIPPERILTVTYTVAATRDMRARFARTFGEDRANRLEFRTINGLSARIIQYYERAMGQMCIRDRDRDRCGKNLRDRADPEKAASERGNGGLL